MPSTARTRQGLFVPNLAAGWPPRYLVRARPVQDHMERAHPGLGRGVRHSHHSDNLAGIESFGDRLSIAGNNISTLSINSWETI